MAAKRKGQPGLWEAEAIQDLFHNKTVRDTFKLSRSYEKIYINLCEYMNEPSNCVKSKQLFHAAMVYYYNSCIGDFETKKKAGNVGGLSEEFLSFAISSVPNGTSLKSLLERASEKSRAGASASGASGC